MVSGFHVQQMLKKLGGTSAVVPVTISYTLNSGEKYTSDGSSTTYNAEFWTNDLKYAWEIAGKTVIADAFMNIPIASNVKKGDKVTVNSVVYIIDSANRKYAGKNALYDFCLLIRYG